ncbi:MAG: nucleotide exchange factor GrpE [Bacilli bacterium]|nr:nucleotide exchange factor GrpE [Bacilli bacterium]
MSKHKNHHEKEMVTASEEQEVLKEENTNQEVPVKEKECKCSKEKEKTIELQKELEESKKQIEVLNQKIGSMQEALLRNQAELQNYKRRKEEESEKVLKYKNEDLIKELLTVVDNFERAISMDDNDLSDEVSKFLAGFKLIYTTTIGILNKFEVKEIQTEGIEFDPEYHHAVLTDHDESKPSGVVLEVLQKGYMYKDRVIRPAMVKVNE